MAIGVDERHVVAQLLRRGYRLPHGVDAAGPGYRVSLRPRPGGDHHGLGAQEADAVGRGLDAALDRHSQLQALALEIRPRVGELVARLDTRGKVHLAANLLLALPQGHVVASRRRHPRYLQAARAASHHQHALALLGRRESALAPFGLLASGGVHQTGDGPV